MYEEAGGFGRAISIINRKALGYFTRRLKPLGLGPGQQAYLLALAPGETATQEELARRLCVDKANASRAARGLEELGYLSRVRSGGDARTVELSLTEGGREARRAAERIAADWIALLKKPLPPDEWRAAESALERIAAALNEHEVSSI